MRAAIYTTVFFFLAPGFNAALVPWALTQWDRPAGAVSLLDIVGWSVGVTGLLVVVACFSRFVTEGHGTPAPPSPTEALVVGGIYRHVRNPMYVGVAAVIGGQALVFRSWPVFVWMGVFLVVVFAFVRAYEEPTLTEQFGTSYEDYREHVPGWWPRLKPYRPDQP